MCEHWRWHLGETNASHPAAVRDRRMPADRKKNYVRYSNFHQIRRNKRLGMIHLNWWCREVGCGDSYPFIVNTETGATFTGPRAVWKFTRESAYPDKLRKTSVHLHAIERFDVHDHARRADVRVPEVAFVV